MCRGICAAAAGEHNKNTTAAAAAATVIIGIIGNRNGSGTKIRKGMRERTTYAESLDPSFLPVRNATLIFPHYHDHILPHTKIYGHIIL